MYVYSGYLNQAKLRHQSPLTYQLEEELVVGPPKNIMQEESMGSSFSLPLPSHPAPPLLLLAPPFLLLSHSSSSSSSSCSSSSFSTSSHNRSTSLSPLLAVEDIPVVKWKPQANTEDDVPIVKWKPQANTEEDVPIIKWKPQANTEEDVPIVKWKPQANTEEDVPVIKWKPQANTEEDVPVIKWKPHANTEDDIPVVKWKPQVAVSGEDDVPVVKWKARQPEPPPMDDTETIPVVKWNARVPSEDVPIVKWKGPSANEDIPVVSWRTPVPKTSDEDIPVVRWKSQPSSAPQLSRNRSPARGKVRNMPVKAIIPSGRRQHGEVEDLEEEERGGYRDGEVIGVSNGEMEPEQVAMGLEEGGENLQQPQRLSRFAAHYSSPSSLSPVSQRKNVSRSPSDSPSFGRRPSPSGRLPKPVRNVSPGNPNLHSRSPSPPVVRYSSHAGAKSRSPSPSLRYTGQTGLSTSPRMQQRIPKAQLPSPASRSNHTPPGTSLVSPNTSRRRPSPSRPATDQHTPPSTRHPSGLPHPPSSSNRRSKVTGIRAPQQSSYTGLSTSSETPPSSRAAQSSLPAGGGKRGITPPGQGGRQRRTLPTPPSQDGSARKPPSKTTPLRLVSTM